MDLREFEVFLAVADELHFRRAAERLYLSPSRVSHVIRSVEERIGAPLFVRANRQVSLTPLGLHLQEALRPAISRIDSAVDAAKRLAQGLPPPALITRFTATLDPEIQAALMEGFQQKTGVPCVRYVEPGGRMVEWMQHPEDGVFITWFPEHPSQLRLPNVAFGPTIGFEHRAILVAPDHPLAECTKVDVEELAEHDVIEPGSAAGLHASVRHAWTPPNTPNGRPIPRAAAVGGVVLEEFFEHVRRRGVVHLTIRSLGAVTNLAGLRLVPLVGLPPFHLVPMWSPERESESIRLFARTAVEIGKESGWLDPVDPQSPGRTYPP